MAKKIFTQNTAPKALLEDFEELTKPILKLIEKYWDFKVSPKGYKKFLEDYQEWKGMGEEEYDLHDDFIEFGGVLNISGYAPALPGCIDMPTVAHNDKQQGRSPLQTLIGAFISYGITVGKAQEERFSDKIDYKEKYYELLEITTKKEVDFSDTTTTPERKKKALDMLNKFLEDMENPDPDKKTT